MQAFRSITAPSEVSGATGTTYSTNRNIRSTIITLNVSYVLARVGHCKHN